MAIINCDWGLQPKGNKECLWEFSQHNFQGCETSASYMLLIYSSWRELSVATGDALYIDETTSEDLLAYMFSKSTVRYICCHRVRQLKAIWGEAVSPASEGD